MTCRRRRYTALLLTCLGLVGGLPAQDVAPDPEVPLAADDVRVTARAATFLMGAARRSCPVPLYVQVECSDEGGLATLEAWTGEREQASLVRRTLRLSRGRFQYRLYPLANRDRLRWRLLDAQGARLAGGEQVLQQLADDHHLIAWRGDRPDLRPHDVLAKPAREQTWLRPLHLANVHHRELLPDRWYGYLAADTLLWDASRPVSLEPAQAVALRQWLDFGGSLVLALPPGETRYYSPLPEHLPHQDVRPSPVNPAFWRPARDDASWQRQQLGTVAPFGLGRVVFLHCAPESLPTQPRDAVETALWGYATPRPPADRQTLVYAASAVDLGNELRQPLARAVGYSTVPFLPVFALGLAYLLTISLGDYLLWRGRRRPIWTWLTFPAATLAFAAIAYVSFRQDDGSLPPRCEVQLRDADSQHVRRSLVFGCVRQKGRRPSQFDAGSLHYVALEDLGFGGGTGALAVPRVIETQSGETGKHLEFPGVRGSFRFYRRHWAEVDSPAPLRAELRRRPGRAVRFGPDYRLSIDVENRGTLLFRDLLLVCDGYVYQVSAHELGQTQELVPAMSVGRPEDSVALLAPGGGSDLDLLLNTRRTLLQGLSQRGPNRWSGGTDLYRSLDRDHALLMAFADGAGRDPDVRRLVVLRQLLPVDEGGQD